MDKPIFYSKISKYQNSFIVTEVRNTQMQSLKHGQSPIPKMGFYKSVSFFVDMKLFSKYLTVVIFLSFSSVFGQQKKIDKSIPSYPFKSDIQRKISRIDRMDDFIVSRFYKEGYMVSDSLNNLFAMDPWLTKEDTMYINSGTVKPAVPFFAEMAKSVDVLLVSEMHHDPKTRAFMTALLPDLKKAGFTHFSAEAILDTFSYSKSRKYPIRKDTMLISSPNNFSYLYEPVYAEMIRTAANLNYDIFSYEAQNNFVTKYEKDDGSFRRETPDGKYFVEVIMENNTISKRTNYNRDSIQTAQIASVFKANPNAKVVINVGQGHSQKMDGTMRNYLDTMLPKKNIVSVFQYVLGTNYLDTLGDNPIVKLRNIKTPSVILGKYNKEYYLKGDDNTDYVDYHIIHPPTKWYKNSPSWLQLYTKKIRIGVQGTLSQLRKCPCKLAAILISETKVGFNRVVPADIIEIESKDKSDEANLYVNPGDYYILGWNKFGERIVDIHSVKR
jgi:hypothetical protein